MSNRTWVCLRCRKAQRKDQSIREVLCPQCKGPCEYVHWKIRVPSPKRVRAWNAFWKTYLAEKALLAEFEKNPTMKQAKLVLLNQRLKRK